MKIEQAIEHLDDCMSESEKILWPECEEAHKLGIEALKEIKLIRKLFRLGDGEVYK